MTRVGPSFSTVVVVLLRAAWTRAAARRRRLRRLYQARGGGGSIVISVVSFLVIWTFSVTPHSKMANALSMAIPAAEQIQAEARGRVVVDEWFAGKIERHEADAAHFPEWRAAITNEEDAEITREAERLAGRSGDAAAIAAHLRQVVRQNPTLLLSKSSLWWQPGSLPDIFALIALVWWALMVICLGEGLGFDTRRPRYPMWEWLFSHPVPSSAVFLAEMLSPIAASPIYLAAPLLPALLYGRIYGFLSGVAAAALVGVPVVIALSCLSRAIQIWVVLRLSPRARATALGLMAWFGTFSVLAIILISSSIPAVVAITGPRLLLLTHLFWPRTRLLAGLTAGGNHDFWWGVAACWIVSAVAIVAALALAVSGTHAGITGRSGSSHASPRARKPARFGRASLYRRELLWLWRDRNALVQTILVPVSLAAFQVFSLHQALAYRGDAWNVLCGEAVVFGIWFLFVVGPGSLAAEGSALWIALSWPRHLESLLEAKAKLWMALASSFVSLGLLIAAVRYPFDIPGILFVAILWIMFGWSFAKKTTTLATTVSSSGEPEKVSRALIWGAALGTFPFAIGIFTLQWGLAITGVVYSVVTAAAMWQTFRYRLPYLLDPWSQKLPPAPTVFHAMVAISVTVEVVAVLSALGLVLFGRTVLAPIIAGLYGVGATAAAIGVSRFLARRGVRQRNIWLWRDAQGESRTSNVILLIAGGATLGAALGGVAHIYLTVLHQFPAVAEMIDNARRQMDALPHAYLAFVVIAVALAPFSEEFLFRGLLYRTLDGEWGGWRAVTGAAAFFALYHPVISWAPVAVLGAMNAIIYKRTGHLAPSVAAHMAYNAVIFAFS